MKNYQQQVTIEILIRLILGIIFWILDYAEPFERKIQIEELWLYKYPRTPSYVPDYLLWPLICIIPFLVIFISNLLFKNKMDGFQAFLALTLTYGLNGVITNTIKLIVGRPRPDFLARCFPDNKNVFKFPCTGKKNDVIEGMKSFPSGHSSFIFASMIFCTLYLSGKLQLFTVHGRGQAWRLLIAFSPLFIALSVALSRTCDYHHHWQDVLAGALLGTSIALLCYFQYYPALNHPQCALPYCSILMTLSKTGSNDSEQLKNSDNLEEVAVKWI